MIASNNNVLALVNFPSHFDLEKIKRTIVEDHPYLQNIEIVFQHAIRLRFQSIADLLDLDLRNSYGAIGVQLEQGQEERSQENLKMNLFSSFGDKSDYTFESESKLLVQKSCVQMENIQPLRDGFKLSPKMERMTSLEDEILEDQRLRKYFELYESDENDNIWDPIAEQVEKEEDTMEPLDNSDQETSRQKKESLWPPLISGIAMTAMVLGGYKVITKFFNL